MNQSEIEDLLVNLSQKWPVSSVADDVMVRIKSEPIAVPVRSTVRRWRVGILASAAAASIVIGFALVAMLSAPRTLQAQVERALARTTAAHISSWELDEKGVRQETNIWYSRERGFRMESPEQIIVYDGKQQWEWQPGDAADETPVVLRRGGDGQEIIAGMFAPLKDAPADWKRHRAAEHDREINGVRCQRYLVTAAAQEPSENVESVPPRNPLRTIVWTDPQDRIVEAEQQRQVQGQWQPEYHASIRYDADLPADKFIVNLPAGAKVVSPKESLEKRYPLADALASKESHGLLFAIHEAERIEGGLIYIVSSVRGTPAHLKAHPPTRRRDFNMTASILDVARVPNTPGNIDGNWNRASLAGAEHEGVYYSWWLAVPRSSFVVKDGVEVQLQSPLDPGVADNPRLTLYAWPHDLRDARGVGEFVSATFELSPSGKSATLNQIATRVLRDANDLTAHGVGVGLSGGINNKDVMQNMIPRGVDADQYVKGIRSQLAWLHKTDDVTELSGAQPLQP